MPTIIIPLAAVLLAIAGPAAAQAQHGHHGAGRMHDQPAPQASPYAGMQQRGIKALSDQQIADLRAGRGMGLALAAELNGYPGPLHALELADRLGLSPDQRARTEAALASMKDETAAIGRKVIAGEAELDALFAGRTVAHESLDAVVVRIATAQGRLRAAHLRYHLQMAGILTPDQATTYAQLRGYGSGAPASPVRQ